MTAHRVCADCHETKPLSEFYRKESGSYDGRCKPCKLTRSNAAAKAARARIREARHSEINEAATMFSRIRFTST